MDGYEFLKQFTKSSQSLRMPVYYFYGEEDYLMDTAITRIAQAAGCDTKLLYFGDEAKKDDIIRSVQETGLFDTSRKFVVLKKAEKFKPLAELVLAGIWRTSSPLIIICEAEKRVCLKKMEKLDRIFVVEFSLLDQGIIRRWVRKKLADEGIKFDEKTLDTLIGILPRRLREIDNELKKIILYIGEKKILTLEDILSVVTPYEEARAYRLYSLVKAKDRAGALKELDILNAAGVQSRNMVSYLSSVYRNQLTKNLKIVRTKDFENFRRLIALEADLRSRVVNEDLATRLALLDLIEK